MVISSSINSAIWDKSTRRHRILHILNIIISVVLFFVLIVFLGSEMEKHYVSKESDTSWAYTSSEVCGYAGDRSIKGQYHINNAMSTYETYEEARKDGASVSHCGDCGWCSNVQDINIIEKTKNTLTETTTRCAKLAIPFSRGRVERCMDDNVGFTPDCRDCWVDNIMCTLARCGFTCAISVFLYKEKNNVNGDPVLNPCLECDEKMCGPNFIRCAGANRRRSGIISDIQRNNGQEVCKNVDQDWIEWLKVLNAIHKGHFWQYSRHPRHIQRPASEEL